MPIRHVIQGERMSKTGWIAILFLLISSTLGPAALSAEKPGKLIPVRMGIVSRSTLDMPFYVARDRGFFREEGLEAEIVLMRANLTVQAMLGRSEERRVGKECRA